MRILIVAEKSVLPAVNYGGLHRMVWGLGKALTEKGHHVTYLCAKGSACPFAKIIERDASKTLESQIPDDIDIVHFHTSVPEEFGRPFVDTIHGNNNPKYTMNSIFVSRDHAARFGSNSYVYNGLDWSDAEYGEVDLERVRNCYHFLGKAAWSVKNVKGAIDIADHLKSGEKIEILGGSRVNFHMGLRITLSRRAVFHGMCGGDLKREVMMRSRGLIFPVVWHEPFGLAVIESLYFGAPVFCTPFGALPEIVTPEVGCMTDRRSEMLKMIEDAIFDPKVCHEYARETFNASRMADGYLSKYEKVLNGHSLNEELPCHVAGERPTIWVRE